MTFLERLRDQRRALQLRMANVGPVKRLKLLDMYRRAEELVQAEEERIDDQIVAWHAAAGCRDGKLVSLHAWLGYTEQEFHRFVGCTSCRSPALAIFRPCSFETAAQ